MILAEEMSGYYAAISAYVEIHPQILDGGLQKEWKKEQNAKKLKLLPLFFSYVPEYPYVAYRERDV